jgi:hypothetical protein
VSDYSGVHARAVSTVARKGVAVTFTLGATTVSGYAIQDTGSLREFQSQGLIEASDEVLFFTPTTIGECPEPEYTLSGFGDVDFVTKRVFPLSPNGTAIGARVIVSR